MASLYARDNEGDSALKQLHIFATNFCSPNSFHLNGDQKGGQYSGFTYRPFTLEGNFAFAEGVHELLLQKRGNVLEVFPALPADWKNVSFTNLRAEGAFLVSAKITGGKPVYLKLIAEKGGDCILKTTMKNYAVTGISTGDIHQDSQGNFHFNTKKGQVIVFRAI
jgi:alpha-L-fucosidase 2